MDRRLRPPRARALLRAALPITATAALVLGASGAASAAIGPVRAAPSSGPPGTTFTVSGSGCGPGLTVSAADYVSVSSTSLPLDVHVPVNGTGSWSTTFQVPGGALPLPALIAAACFTNGLPSLTTIYTPATFVVTAASTAPPPPPPTTPTTSGSNPTPTTRGTTASTQAGGKGAGPGAGSGANAGPGSGSTSGSKSSGGARTSSGRAGAGGTVTAAGAGGGAAKRSGAVAGLRSPELASDSRAASSGINPWWWALLAVLAAGAIAAWLRLRRRGDSAGQPGSTDEPAADGEPGTTGPDDDLDDDWPEFPVLDEAPTITR